ncbi:calcium-dependent protein kinase 28-like [Iris pallida]|uniref:Calcium-dependent protein kinase 28-like n=1 Tax=Iris pallida TaxID=29817 RepID=A0AAX6HY79_IRIPA|nr:calcium-dependent protein kinase 28-like [Iris pallida]
MDIQLLLSSHDFHEVVLVGARCCKLVGVWYFLFLYKCFIYDIMHIQLLLFVPHLPYRSIFLYHIFFKFLVRNYFIYDKKN